MLFDASLYVAKMSTVTTMIARTPSKLQQLKSDTAQLNSLINPIALDYTDSDQLISQLECSIDQHGPVELAVLWIHSTAPDAPSAIGSLVNKTSKHAKIYHVRGSSVANPNKLDYDNHQSLRELKNVAFHEIILGFVVEESRSRWLTNKEISQGVIEAIENEAEKFVVGAVEPWGARP